MDTSLKGHSLPTSYAEHQQLITMSKAKFDNCLVCSKPFTPDNVPDDALSWRETQISGTCTKCWNLMFSEYV